MVLCFQNCFDLLCENIIHTSDREKLLKFKAEGREFAKCLFESEKLENTA